MTIKGRHSIMFTSEVHSTNKNIYLKSKSSCIARCRKAVTVSLRYSWAFLFGGQLWNIYVGVVAAGML